MPKLLQALIPFVGISYLSIDILGGFLEPALVRIKFDLCYYDYAILLFDGFIEIL